MGTMAKDGATYHVGEGLRDLAELGSQDRERLQDLLTRLLRHAPIHPPTQPRVSSRIVVRLEQPSLVLGVNNAIKTRLTTTRRQVRRRKEEPLGLVRRRQYRHARTRRRRHVRVLLLHLRLLLLLLLLLRLTERRHSRLHLLHIRSRRRKRCRRIGKLAKRRRVEEERVVETVQDRSEVCKFVSKSFEHPAAGPRYVLWVQWPVGRRR